MNTAMNVAGRGVELNVGEAECAAIQTVHVADSLAFEWWCAAKASADQKVSTRHNNATLLNIDCTPGDPSPRAGTVCPNANSV